MKTYFYRRLVMATLLLVVSGSALATTSAAQLDVEGNATCSSLSTNAVLQAKDLSYAPGVNGYDSVAGPDGQVFTYQIGPANTISQWSVSNPLPASGTAKPVSYVIVKEAGNSGGVAFYYGNPGVYSDSNATKTGMNSAVTVSFCYGLLPPFTPLEPTALPLCDASLCPDPSDTTIQARILTQFDEPADNEHNWQVQTCSCGTFTECNPDLLAGTVVPPGIPGACTSGGPNLFLPIEVQLARDPDSYYCTVINGTRRCYRK